MGINNIEFIKLGDREIIKVSSIHRLSITNGKSFVIKKRSYSPVKYCYYGGDEFDLPVGTKGEIISEEGNKLRVKFENNLEWSVHRSELEFVPVDNFCLIFNVNGDNVIWNSLTTEEIEKIKNFLNIQEIS